MSVTEDTQPFLPIFDDNQPTDRIAPLAGTWVIGQTDDAEIEEARKWLPSATVVRAVIFTALPFIGGAVGVGSGLLWVEPFLWVYSLAGPAVLGWWLHRRHKRKK